MSIFYSRILPGYHITKTCHFSLSSSWLWPFGRQFLMILIVFRSSGQIFWGMLFSFLKSSYVFWEGRTEVKCYSRHIIWRVIPATWLHLLPLSEIVLVKLLQRKVSVPPFSVLCSLERSRYAQPTFKEWGVIFPLLRMHYLYNFFGIFLHNEFILSPKSLFIQSLIYINVEL